MGGRGGWGRKGVGNEEEQHGKLAMPDVLQISLLQSMGLSETNKKKH